MQIIPAILEKNPSSFFSQIKRLLPYFKHFQIDIANESFVSNRTVQIEEITQHLPHFHLQNYIHTVSFDFHLMVKDYQTEVEKLLKLKDYFLIKTIFVHYSLLPNIQYLKSNFPFSFGLVLNPEDSVEKLSKLYSFKTISSIQIMSIHPGFQGAQFLPQTLQKVEQLRLLGYRSKIYLDGGINDETLRIILSRKYIPDALVVGSYLTKAENLKERVKFLKEKIKK